MRKVAIDTETYLIAAGMIAPRLVCVSWAEEIDGAVVGGLLDREDGVERVRALLADPLVVIIGHNIPYDLGVLCAEDPELLPLVFAAYEAGRIRDTMIRQKLLDIQRGELKFRHTKKGMQATDHALATLSQIHLGETLKKEGTYRVRYHELADVPLHQWPKDAYDYAVTDAITTYRVYAAQGEPSPNEPQQAQAAWALHLMSLWGVRTDAVSTAALRARLTAEKDAALEKLRKTGIIRADGSKDLKLIRERVKAGYDKAGSTPPTTEKAHQIQTSEEVLLASGDPDLMVLAEASSGMKLLSTYVPVLELGTSTPICARYNVLVESGRTSCSSPNMQNPPRLGGVRESFVPRPGFLYCSVDYDTLELRSLAQVCLDMFGHSNLADAFKRGEDPHLNLAAQSLGIPVEEAKARKKAGDRQIKDARQFSKIANFGYPGGLGPDTFVAYAKNYGSVVSVDEARSLREAWFAAWPEMKDYFRAINDMGDTVTQFRSDRVRGGVEFCQRANTFFQGLAADGAKQALWDVSRSCYVDRSSPLFGSRPVIFLHDEIIAEVPGRFPEVAAQALADTMIAAMSKWIPDVPITASPVLMRRWYKEAEPAFDAAGKLIPWEPKEPK